MGLDMYAYAVEQNAAVSDFDFARATSATRIHQWRKHYDLHGWMETLYRTKGGQDEMFNCNLLRLTPEDLDRLETAVRSDEIGEEPDEEGRADDLAFIARARLEIEQGRAVYYDSWW